ncbi:glycosyltransferase family 1 protein [Cristinia sonorae]|uniref:sterol 3beta-glucosyltransferase n=1 Tax=Cristinia sonorae TaxID=1940300 RepID=A0A8K0UVF0_9AGAR|nr:glycosyltransferase family 1 protein [Cristinia sonorae]
MRFFDYHRRDSKHSPSRDSSFSADDPADSPVSGPSLTQFFADASLYKQAIANPDRANFYRASENETIQDFADLVGRHLAAPERALADKFARLSVEDSTWLSDEKAVLVDEPQEDLADHDSQSETPPHPHHAPERPEGQAQTEEVEAPQLSPDEIVELLRHEYGPLGPDGEEKLIMEADAALVQDVVVMGVLHITTHRVAFHASLLDEASRGNRVILAGPAVVHRRGLHRKRRVWMELSRDFICTFPSAQETDRMRPLRSIVLSTILQVKPEDPENPRICQAIFDGSESGGNPEVYAEFDTVESAREWRREIQAALFLYKRSLLATMQGIEEENDGVRINIPMHCVEAHSVDPFVEMFKTISLSLSTAPGDETASSNSDSSIQSIQFVQIGLPHTPDACVEAIVEAKKNLPTTTEEEFIANRKVMVDYGSLGFPVTDGFEGGSPKSREQLVCDAIGIGAVSDVWMTKASINGVTISSGYFVVTAEWVGFWSKSLAHKDHRYRIAMSTIRAAKPTGKGCKYTRRGLTDLHLNSSAYHVELEIQGHPDMRFIFCSAKTRDEAIKRIQSHIKGNSTKRRSSPSSRGSTPPTSPTPTGGSTPTLTRSSTSLSTTVSSRFSARSSSSLLAPLSRVLTATSRKVLELTPQVTLKLPKAINVPRGTPMPIPKTKFACLTIGSRGDVQPYIALSLGLKKAGHEVMIITHEEYKGWVESFGIEHRTAGGDPGMLMKLSVDNKMFSPQFFKESISNYRKWLDALLLDAWEQCKGAQVLLESPYAMAGVHIAEALGIPYFRVCTMPWTKTTQFPHPFISPPVETPKFNSMSYVLFDNVFWAATSTQINRWRTEHLHIPATDMSHLAQSKIPMIYNFSPSVVPKPLDWNDTRIETGYWFLDNSEGLSWTPPPSLVEFMDRARADGKPLVYIGFGSITVPNPNAVTEKICQAVVKSDVRAIVSKGWSARMAKDSEKQKEVEMPKECYAIDKIPHDWLFPKIDAALHHGGAGTTSASLRAGIPTLIKPWFGDQFFWASRVHKLGAGMRVPSLRVNDLAVALTRATSDRIMKEKAMLVGERIRSEDGVQNAIRFISIYMPTAMRSPTGTSTPIRETD